MPGKAATLAIKIVGDASSGIKALDDTDSRVGSFLSGGIGKVAGVVAGAFAVDKVVEFGKASFDAASNLEQMQGSLDAVFGSLGDSRVQMTKWSLDADKAVGLSSAAYDQVASVIGSQLKNAGTPMDELAGKTNNLIQQGADMSAVFGGSAADAVDALSSVLKGEYDPIEKYGVSLNATSIAAELASRGQDKLTGAALKQAQTQAALDIVTRQTAQTQGQFAAQSGTAAEKSQQLGAWFDNLQAKVGSYLLPAFVSITDFISTKVGPTLDKLTSDGGPLGNMLGSIGDVIVNQVVPGAEGLYDSLAPKLVPILETTGRIVRDDVVPVLGTLGKFVRDDLIPIIENIAGPALGGLNSAWHSIEDALERNKGKFSELYDNIKPFLTFLKNDVAPFVGGTLKLGFEAAGEVLGKLIDSIAWILDKGSKVVGFLGNLFGAGQGAAGRAPARSSQLFGAAPGSSTLRGASAGGFGGGGAPVVVAADTTPATVINITVNGAIDPDSVADQIAGLLDRRARRTGQLVAAGRFA